MGLITFGDVDKVDGKHANNTADNIPTLDSDALIKRAQLPKATTALYGAVTLNDIIDGTLEEDGYVELANGLIVQWMTGPEYAASEGIYYTINFPTPFKTACFNAQATVCTVTAGDTATNAFFQVIAKSKEGVTVLRQNAQSIGNAIYPFIVAIGI